MSKEADIKALEKEIDRLRDKAMNMFEEKYSKQVKVNHERITRLEKQLKMLKEK